MRLAKPKNKVISFRLASQTTTSGHRLPAGQPASRGYHIKSANSFDQIRSRSQPSHRPTCLSKHIWPMEQNRYSPQIQILSPGWWPSLHERKADEADHDEQSQRLAHCNHQLDMSTMVQVNLASTALCGCPASRRLAWTRLSYRRQTSGWCRFLGPDAVWVAVLVVVARPGNTIECSFCVVAAVVIAVSGRLEPIWITSDRLTSPTGAKMRLGRNFGALRDAKSGQLDCSQGKVIPGSLA